MRTYWGPLLLCAAWAGALPGQVRIASLNIAKQYGPKLLSGIAHQPDLKKADILLLQEVVDGEQSHTADAIAQALGMKAMFAPAFRLNSRFEEGLAIVSRYPLSDRSVMQLPHNDLHFHTRNRIALAATAATPLGPLRVMDIHLDNRINAEAKRLQLDVLWQDTDRHQGAFVIGGDFNSANFHWASHVAPWPGEGLNAMIRGEMARHGFSTPLLAGPGTLHFMGLKIDWIYLRDLTALDSGVTPIGFSDHNSVWVILRSGYPVVR